MSDETNVDVTTPSTNPDGNYHSFDELDSSTETRSDAELISEAKKTVEDDKAATKEDLKEAISESKKEDAVSEKTVQENIADAGETAVEEIVEEIKKLEARFGDERLEIPQDAVISVKIDGEEQEISLNDLKSNYSGKVAWDKKFNELGQEKKQFTEERSVIEKYINEFAELAQKGDNAGAMEYLASLSGQNPLEFRRSLRNQIIEEHKQMLQMDEGQKEAFEIKEENEFLKRQQESDAKRSEEQQSVQELQKQISEFQEAHEVSSEELLAAYDDLQENFEGEIGLDTIQEYVSASRAYKKTEEIIQPIASSEIPDEVYDDLAGIVLENPDFEASDIEDIFREAYPDLIGKSSKKVASKKAVEGAKKAQKEGAGDSYKEKLARNKLEEFFGNSFDDL